MCVLFYFEENISKIKFNVYELRTLIVYIILYLITFLKKSYFIVLEPRKIVVGLGPITKKIEIIKTSVDTITIGDYIRREKK